MSSSKTISVIIPAHNCASSLVRAVNSVPESNDIEVIIVENGSTDNTVDIAKQIISARDNVLLLQSEQGVSQARNKGMSASHGAKIMFLDADDYYRLDLLTLVNDSLSHDLDIYSFESGTEKKLLFQSDHLFTGNEKEALIGEMLDFPTSFLTVWGKVFDAQIIQEHHILFPTELSLSEDSVFLLKYLTYCQNIGGYSNILYHYTHSINSTVHTFDKQMVEKYSQSLQYAKEIIDNQKPHLIQHYYKYGLMQLNLIGVHGIFSPQNPMSFHKKVGLLKDVTHRQVFAECLKSVHLSDLNSVKFIAIIMIKLKLFSLAGLIFKARNRFS